MKENIRQKNPKYKWCTFTSYDFLHSVLLTYCYYTGVQKSQLQQSSALTAHQQRIPKYALGCIFSPHVNKRYKRQRKIPPGGKVSRLRQRMLWVPAGLVEPHPQQEWSQHPIIHIWLRSNAFSCVGNNPQHPLIRWTSLHTCTHTSLCSNQSRSWPTL